MRRDAFAHDKAAKRPDRAERGKPQAAGQIHWREIGEQRAIEPFDHSGAE